MAKGRANGFARSMTGAARSQPIPGGCKAGLPFGGERRWDQTLACSVRHDGNAQGPLLGGARLREPHPTHRLRRLSEAQGVHQREALGWGQRLHPNDPGGFLALVSLSDFPDG